MIGEWQKGLHIKWVHMNSRLLTQNLDTTIYVFSKAVLITLNSWRLSGYHGHWHSNLLMWLFSHKYPRTHLLVEAQHAIKSVMCSLVSRQRVEFGSSRFQLGSQRLWLHNKSNSLSWWASHILDLCWMLCLLTSSHIYCMCCWQLLNLSNIWRLFAL